MSDARSGRPAALLTLALFLATGIGVPVHHHADHDGDQTHLTAGDHGHGATLVVRDMRTERPAPTIDVPVTSGVVKIRAPRLTQRGPRLRIPTIPRGRSPPVTVRPRAPPSSS